MTTTINASNRPLNVNATVELPYSVNIWQSHPDAGNDDCHTGRNYATNAEACAAFMGTANDGDDSILAAHGKHEDCRAYYANWQYVEVDGPDVYLVAKNPRYNEKRARRDADAADAEWRSERAMQSGMMGGVEAYNDEFGY